MILADTSAWVEFDRATGSPVDERITELLGAGGELAVTEPVWMEVLSGARNNVSEQRLRRLLLSCEWCGTDVSSDFDAAQRIYRTCRGAGVTPRGLLDCLIAAVAWRAGAQLLAYDADLARIANVIGIEMDEASLLV